MQIVTSAVVLFMNVSTKSFFMELINKTFYHMHICKYTVSKQFNGNFTLFGGRKGKEIQMGE
jgi:hypothetical protein